MQNTTNLREWEDVRHEDRFLGLGNPSRVRNITPGIGSSTKQTELANHAQIVRERSAFSVLGVDHPALHEVLQIDFPGSARMDPANLIGEVLQGDLSALIPETQRAFEA
jgi:hypothetical protein